jgi:hypothetical protein
MSAPIDRRKFLSRAVLATAALAVPRSAFAARRRAPAPLRIAVIPSTRSPDRALGIQLGVEEARHAADLFGGSIDLRTAGAHEPLASAAARLLAEGPALLIGGDDAAECARLADLAGTHRSRAVYFNVGCDDVALRGTVCRRDAYPVCPSATMLAQAVEQARAAAGPHATASAWDPSLVKFGADTLNGRFKKQFGHRMSSDGWTAWVAVKIVWEASLRARSTSGTAIAAFLDSPAAQFDGHKGRALSFRSWNHQLRQPVYALAPGRPPVEVPSSRNEDDVRASLDRLGVTQRQSTCTL